MGARLATFANGGGFPARNHAGFGGLLSYAALGHKNPIAAMRANSPFMRANTPFPRDSQEIIDSEIIRVGRQGLVIADDLLDSNLSKPLPNWLSLTTYTSQRASEAGRAQVGMTPNTRGERQVADLSEYSVPVFCVWDDWEFDARTLATAARIGMPINTDMVEQATRNVNERLEAIFLHGVLDGDDGVSGAAVKFYDLPVYGLLNAPNANTYAYTGGVAWDDAAKTGADILADIINMLEALDADNFTGPYTLYVPTSYSFKFMGEYATGYPRTILSRLQEIPGLTIKVAPSLPANRTILIQKTRNVFDILVGMTPTSFSWDTNPQQPFSGVSSMVCAVIIPRPKYDYTNQSGILLGYTS
jgi:hypothetical protein